MYSYLKITKSIFKIVGSGIDPAVLDRTFDNDYHVRV